MAFLLAASAGAGAVGGSLAIGPALSGDAGAIRDLAPLLMALPLLSGAILLASLAFAFVGILSFSSGRTELGKAHAEALLKGRLFIWLGIALFFGQFVASVLYGMAQGGSLPFSPTERELVQFTAHGNLYAVWVAAFSVAFFALYMDRLLSALLEKRDAALRLSFLALSVASGFAAPLVYMSTVLNWGLWTDWVLFDAASKAVSVSGWLTVAAMACYFLLLRSAKARVPDLAAGVVAGGPGPAAERPIPEGPLLSVNGLTVRFYTYDGVLKALDGVSLSVGQREIFGVVGETGCGKSVMAKSILRLIPDPPGRIVAGEVVFEGINFLDSIEQEARIRVNDRGRAKIKRNRRIARRMEALMRTIRGNVISMIFQEPSAALNPVLTVRKQIGESFTTHQLEDICRTVSARQSLNLLQRSFFALLSERGLLREEMEVRFRDLTMARAAFSRAQAASDVAATVSMRDNVGRLDQEVIGLSFRLGAMERQIRLWQAIPFVGKRILMKPIEEEVDRRVARMLQSVRIPDPEKKMENFPFELSGGMQQRVMIAMALSCRPRLLIADEPTTALDVTIQAQILSLIRDLRDKFGSSIILITHDLGVVAETCDRVGVMYAGVMAEIGQVDDIFSRPKHPYTVGLLRSIPETYARTGSLAIIPGSVPSLLDPPSGCRFHPRCPFASQKCADFVPQPFQVGEGHMVACHLYDHPEFFPPETLAERDAGLTKGWKEVRAL